MTAAPSNRPALALYAKLVVLAVFVLIFLGGLVTSWGAGMAAPDWPLSYGSINPAGWWDNFPLRLEHGHRLTASLVGVLTLGLMGWVWRNRWIAGTAVFIGLGLVYSFFAGTQHEARSAEHMHEASWWIGLGILIVVALLSLVLFKASPPAAPGERTVRWLSWAAFVAVCVQATLGGLRVTEQTGGLPQLALALRIFHGCVAQAFLCLVVATAAILSPRWATDHPTRAAGRARRLAWMTFGFIFIQLIFGATMRHLGAGLAIPTFPAASPEGGFMPHQHNVYVDLNFTHTRFLAFLVTLHIFLIALRVFRTARGEGRLVGPAVTLLALVAIQITLGIFVILHTKPPTLTTFHVLNGAALLATSLLLALRLYRFGPAATLSSPGTTSLPSQVTA